MPYFTKDFIKFFKELSSNNNRDWFNANKERYEKVVKEPFYNLVAEFLTRISFDDQTFFADPKDAIFRIYRDVRFSKDKSPYKLHASAAISSVARAAINDPGFYFELNHKGINIYCGSYMVDKTGLAKIRNYIMHNSKELDKILKNRKFKKLFGGEILGDKQKRLPKELMNAAEKQPLLYNTQFYIHAKLPASIITSDKLGDELYDHYEAAKEVTNFFRRALK